MKNLKSILSAMLISVAFASCEKEDMEPAKSLCETNSTAEICFENKSVYGSTYKLLFDGTVVATLYYGESYCMTVAAGNHSYEFRKSNGVTSACNKAYPNLAQCSSQTFYCTY